MSYIKKIEEDYNNGKISLKEVSDLRENYNKKNEQEKSKIDKQYMTNEQSEPIKNMEQKVMDEGGVNENQINYYYLWLSSCVFFGIIFMRSGINGNLILDFLSTGFIPIVLVSFICFPIKIFSKINFGKLLFWTSVIICVLNLLNGTFN